MVAIIAAGILSYAGKMDLTTSIAVAFVANALGDSLLFYMSRYNKDLMMPYLRKHRRKLALSHILMKKHVLEVTLHILNLLMLFYSYIF